jgi:hypothetical protein
MFLGYCDVIVVLLFPVLIPAFWTSSEILMLFYCFLCFCISLGCKFQQFCLCAFQNQFVCQINMQGCVQLGRTWTLKRHHPFCRHTAQCLARVSEKATEIDRREGSKPQLAKMVRNMNLWLNDSQMVLADQMPVTSAAQTDSERLAPVGNNSATGFANPARDINNLQAGLQNIDGVLHFQGSF